MRPVHLATRKTQKVSVGCPLLDSFLRGGLPCGSLTEFSGESTACKTQFCLQILVNAALPVSEGGLGGRALYIYTEGSPPSGRLEALASKLQSETKCRGSGELLENILVQSRVYSAHSLLAAIQKASETASSQPPLKVVVVDSIAYLFRDPECSKDSLKYVERAAQLFEMATALRKLAAVHNIAVIVTNQVTDVMEGEGGTARRCSHTGGLELTSSGRQVVPALGLAWANCVTSRLFLSRAPSPLTDPATGQQTVLRCLQVVFSPALPQAYCYFQVRPDGVFGLPPASAQHLQR